MPFILNQKDEDLNKQQAGQNISGSSVILDGNNVSQNTPASAATTAATQKSSGSFTNLQSYLDANKDQAAGMGQKVVDNLDSTANMARNFSRYMSPKFLCC